MVYGLIGLAVLLGLWGVVTLLRNSTPQQLSFLLRWGGLVLAIALGALLIVSNRLSFLWTVLPFFLPWLSPRFWLGQFLRYIFKLGSSRSKEPIVETSDVKNAEDAQILKETDVSPSMSRTEALLILGVEEGTTPEEIKQAYDHKSASLKNTQTDQQAAQDLLDRAFRRLNHNP